MIDEITISDRSPDLRLLTTFSYVARLGSMKAAATALRNASGRMRHSVVLDISEHLLDRWIYPDDFGDGGRLRRDATKANRVHLEGGVQRGLSLLANLKMRAVVHRSGGV